MYHFLSTHADQLGQILLGVGIIVLGYIQKKYFKKQEVKSEEIHILVNSRLSSALERIAELEEKLGIPPGTILEPAKEVHDDLQPKV